MSLTLFLRLICRALALVLSIGVMCVAQTSPPASESILPGRPDAATPAAGGNVGEELLGDIFESPAAGIAFRAPAGWKEVRNRAGGGEVVQFVNEAKRWVLNVNRLEFSRPIEMSIHKVKQNGVERDENGLFEETVDRLRTDSNEIQIERQEVFQRPTPDGWAVDIGIVAGQYKTGSENGLSMIALIRRSPADRSTTTGSRVYYSFNLSAILPKDLKPEQMADDRDVRQVADTFEQVIETVRLLDQTAIRDDQNRRLFRTRALFVNLTEDRLGKVIQPEQWLRLIRDGKDVGYTYIVEEIARDIPRHGSAAPPTAGPQGLLVGVRARTMPEADHQVDLGSWMWNSFDRRSEKFSTVTAMKGPSEAMETFTEIGNVTTSTRLVRDDRLEKGEMTRSGLDANQPAMRHVETTTLEVVYKGKGRSTPPPPLRQDLPPFYLPQALGHLLPRLAATQGAKTYMTATYNTDSRAIMSRYIDVEEEKNVTFNGQRMFAIVVRDRLGLEGSVTTHYYSRDGKYLGSVNPDSKIMVLPSDRATLEKMWQNADLARPDEAEDKP